ncbi:Na/Pi symporter [Metabacillus iocasae]|uniref:Phosphate:Na+ symporter n=1 Tax=Priestia iocasae TaxID=2291674 RepID=A0ABS2QPT5_9BACI|nr:Na/Pi symporter [Metabacillus iocasae]MBM7701473.1 phosphate:Na+ symporter [Metabacillus iocasae]
MLQVLSFFTVYIAIFIFGMTVLRTGLYNVSQHKMKQWLMQMTKHPFQGMLVGAFVTAILQSSSAVMVLTVGLVATGYLTFKQSIGIILGTNIGTTITTELITFQIDQFVVPMLVLGALLLLFSNLFLSCIGAMLFGLGCIFVSMNGFEHLAAPLSKLPSIEVVIQQANTSELLGLWLGTFMTAIIQSSTATTGIIMSFLNENILSLQAGIAILFGANIGTCITAILASIGSNREGKLTAFAHAWLNVFGVIVFFPFIQTFSLLATKLTQFPDAQLAHVSLIFNIVCSILALPLTNVLAKFIIKVHGREIFQ